MKWERGSSPRFSSARGGEEKARQVNLCICIAQLESSVQIGGSSSLPIASEHGQL